MRNLWARQPLPMAGTEGPPSQCRSVDWRLSLQRVVQAATRRLLTHRGSGPNCAYAGASAAQWSQFAGFRNPLGLRFRPSRGRLCASSPGTAHRAARLRARCRVFPTAPCPTVDGSPLASTAGSRERVFGFGRKPSKSARAAGRRPDERRPTCRCRRATLFRPLATASRLLSTAAP